MLPKNNNRPWDALDKVILKYMRERERGEDFITFVLERLPHEIVAYEDLASGVRIRSANPERCERVVKAPTDEDSLKAAERVRHAAKEIRTAVHDRKAPQDFPTAERAARANGSKVLEKGRYTLEDSELEKLAARGVLDPEDSDRNKRLLKIFLNYFEVAHRAALLAAGTAPLWRGRIDNTGASAAPWAMPFSESVAIARDEYREAEEALGPFLSPVVNAVVLLDEPILSVGLRVSGYTQPQSARAVAVDRLRQGGARLEALYERGKDGKGTSREGRPRTWMAVGAKPTDNWGKDS